MKLFLTILAGLVLMLPTVCAEEATIPGIREALEVQTATPAPNAFRFRDGIRWGMNPQQVKALESEGMTERTMQDWTVMVTEEKVAVSRFTADLVFMFRQNSLQMITYEFQRQEAESDFRYLTGALSSLYGEAKETESSTIRNLMDVVYPNRYKTEWIKEPCGWETGDGTAIYLYFYSNDAFAIMYVSPELAGGFYQTNGL